MELARPEAVRCATAWAVMALCVLSPTFTFAAPTAAPAASAAVTRSILSELEATQGLTGVGPQPFHPTPTTGSRPHATTYYVTSTGSNSAPCTMAQPCRQISEALALVSAGDTVMVANGTYLGFDVNTLIGTPSAPITLEAPGRAAKLIPTVNRSDNRDTVHIEYSSWIVLDGFEAFDANRAAVRIDQSDNTTVSNGTFGNNTVWGIFTDFDNDTVLEHNTVYGSVQQHGIYESNSPVAPTIRWNLLYGNNEAGLQINADATQGGWGISSGGDIEDNVIYDNGAAGAAGINLDGVWNTRIVNNLLYDNHATGIVNYVDDGRAGPHGMTIMDNTVVMASNGRWALQFLSTTGENFVRNNILDNLNPAHGGEEFGTWDDVNNTSTDYEIESQVTVDAAGVNYALSAWQAMGHEPHSLSATPAVLFVDPALGNYHLLSTAPAIQAGVYLPNVTTDLDGNPRPVGLPSDIGCYQYVPTVLTATASANPTSGYVPLTVAFSSTVTGGNGPYVYVWSYGDGSLPSGAPAPTHTYNATGTFPVVLTVTNATSAVARAYLNVTASKPPALGAGASASPLNGNAPLRVVFSSSVTGGVAPYTYFWTYGTGTRGSHAVDPVHTFNGSGSYPVSLEVNDTVGQTAWSNLTVTVTAVTPPPIQLAITANRTWGIAPCAVSFNSTASGGTPPYAYAWTFGNGLTANGTDNASTVYRQPGTYTVTLTLVDASDNSKSASLTISIDAPLAVRIGGTTSGAQGTVLTFWAVASGGTGGYDFTWNLGSGEGWATTGPLNATNGTFPAGEFFVRVIVNDSGGDSVLSSNWTVNVVAPMSSCCNAPLAGGLSETVLLAIVLGALLGGGLLVALLVLRRRQQRKAAPPPSSGPPPFGEPVPPPPE